MASFGELLSELRKDRYMTQSDLAKQLHVSVSTISNYEKDVHLPDVDKLVSLADFFDVTTDYLLSRTKSSLSPTVFEEPALGKRTVREVLKWMGCLSAEQQRTLSTLMDDMSLAAYVRNSHTGERDSGL